MDTGIREYRNASHLPPVSICLLLAAASVLLLCSRTESAGEPEGDQATDLPAQSIAHAEPRVTAEERQVRAVLQGVDELQCTARPDAAADALREAAELAQRARLGRDLRAEVQLRWALCLDAAGDHEAAVEVWWQLLSMSSQHEEVARGLAASLQASGRLDEAQRVVREMLHSEPETGVQTSRTAPAVDHSKASSADSHSAR